mmetsp:Transcript_35243/g.58900  ORF Transcript_35243/g.58900 Transcript_35243/m.58900 type:complete len:211 (+) Transcript_35243:512-1144(+)
MDINEINELGGCSDIEFADDQSGCSAHHNYDVPFATLHYQRWRLVWVVHRGQPFTRSVQCTQGYADIKEMQGEGYVDGGRHVVADGERHVVDGVRRAKGDRISIWLHSYASQTVVFAAVADYVASCTENHPPRAFYSPSAIVIHIKKRLAAHLHVDLVPPVHEIVAHLYEDRDPSFFLKDIDGVWVSAKSSASNGQHSSLVFQKIGQRIE